MVPVDTKELRVFQSYESPTSSATVDNLSSRSSMSMSSVGPSSLSGSKKSTMLLLHGSEYGASSAV